MAEQKDLSVAPEEQLPSENAETAENENESAEPSQSDQEEIIEIINRFVEDADTSTPEAIISSALKALQSMVPIYDKVYDLVESSPETGAFIDDLLTTGSVPKALARNFDPEEFQALSEEVGQAEDYDADRTAHAEKIKGVKARQELVSGNVKLSEHAITKFQEDRKDWDPKKAEEFEKFVLKFYQDANDGLISEDALSILEKGFNYDTDVADAENIGRVSGRNEKIVTEKLSKAEKENLLPEHSSGKATPPTPPEKKQSFAGNWMKDVI